MSSLTPVGGSLAVSTPFSRAFVDDLKAQVPFAARRWDGAARQWLVDPAYGALVAGLIRRHFGETVGVPAAAAPAPVTRLVELHYLGRCKQRDNGAVTASGYAGGGWSLVFPEAVLRAYFHDDARPAATQDAPAAPASLYAVLGLPAFAEGDVIKAAYKRMAKHTHPDVNREPDATARFQAINHAYDVLKDDKQRRKYDVGLLLEQRAADGDPRVGVGSPPRPSATSDYRAPLTCGAVLLSGVERLGVLHVSAIHHWSDIVNTQGQTMVSSWPAGAEMFETRFI